MCLSHLSSQDTVPGKSGLNHQEMDNEKIEIVGNETR